MKNRKSKNSGRWINKLMLFFTSLLSSVLLIGGNQGNAGGAPEVLVQASQNTVSKTVEELLLIIVTSEDEDEVYRAFCELEDLNFDMAHQASKDYVLGLERTRDYIPYRVGFESCDISGAARLIVI